MAGHEIGKVIDLVIVVIVIVLILFLIFNPNFTNLAKNYLEDAGKIATEVFKIGPTEDEVVSESRARDAFNSIFRQIKECVGKDYSGPCGCELRIPEFKGYYIRIKNNGGDVKFALERKKGEIGGVDIVELKILRDGGTVALANVHGECQSLLKGAPTGSSDQLFLYNDGRVGGKPWLYRGVNDESFFDFDDGPLSFKYYGEDNFPEIFRWRLGKRDVFCFITHIIDPTGPGDAFDDYNDLQKCGVYPAIVAPS